MKKSSLKNCDESEKALHEMCLFDEEGKNSESQSTIRALFTPRLASLLALDSAEIDRFSPRMASTSCPLKTPERSALSSSEPRWVFALGALLLALGIFCAYHRSLHVPFLLDDPDSIEKNPTIRNLPSAFFPPENSGSTVSGRPLLNLSFALNYRFGGTDVLGYHLGNLLIHLLASLSLWGVVRRTLLLPALAPRFGKHASFLAWMIALLWALHPLQTEAVTYLSQRAEALVGLLYLLTLYTFIRSLERARRGWAIATCLLCFLGMAAKEVMVSAPLVLLLYDRVFVSGSFFEFWRRRKGLYLTLASSWLLLLGLIFSTGGRGGSVGFATVTWWEYALTQVTAIVRYLGLAFWPGKLVFDYGARVETDLAIILPCAVVLLSLLSLTGLALKRWPRWGFLGASVFLILAPTSSIVPIATQTIAEHRFYLPLAALIAAGVIGAYGLKPRVALVLFPLLSVVLATVTHARNELYQTKQAIWEDTVRKVPDNVRALDQLGAIYFEVGRTEEAVSLLRRALALNPAYASAQSNLGQALIRLGQPKEGIEAIETALRLVPNGAAYQVAYGNALLDANEPERAVVFLEKASALEPLNGAYHYDLANALATLDRNEEAERHFLAALSANPKDVEALNNYSTLLRRMGRTSEAIAYLEVALQIAPASARLHSNLGVSFLTSNRVPEGIEQLKEAVRLDSGLAQARYNLASAYAQTGHLNEAIEHFEALLRRGPPTADLLSNLGVLYAQTDRLDDAVASLRRALELDPQHRAARETLDKINAFMAGRKLR